MSTAIEIVHGRGLSPSNGSGFAYTDETPDTVELFIFHDRNGKAVCAFYGSDKLINAAEEDSCRSGTTVFWTGTMREYLMNYSGLTPEQEWTESDHEECDWIRAIADEHGWDTTLYRADCLTGEGEYTSEPITHLEAAIAYLEHDGERVRTARWMTDAELDEYLREDDEDDA